MNEAGAIVIQLLVMCVFGGIVAAIANSRGRNAVGWFFIGMVAPCIGLILVLVLPDMKQQEDRERRMAKQNRRLREQLDKERAVADRRHQETQRRLGVHDAALGVDTGDPELLTHDSGAAPVGGSVSGGGGGGGGGHQWHYADGGNQVGPVDEHRMAQLWNQGVIDRQTLVWRDGMSDWEELGGTVLFDRLTD